MTLDIQMTLPLLLQLLPDVARHQVVKAFNQGDYN